VAPLSPTDSHARDAALATPRGFAFDARVPVVLLAGGAFAAWVASSRGSHEAVWFLFALCATWALAPFVARLAAAAGATGLPGGRAIHSRPTPLMGGLAILVPVCAGLVLDGDTKMLGLAAGCLLMALVGTIDDLRGLSPRAKVLAQVIGAVILAQSGFRLGALEAAPFGPLATGAFELPLLVLWVVVVTNAVNLIDGLDGLATGICLFAALACAILGLGGVAPVLLGGALLGFARHNLPRARLFLGDAGSLALGFALAALLLEPGSLNLPAAVGVLALPLGDLLLSSTRRWLRGKPIFTADRGHVHHLLLNRWHNPERALAALLAFNALHVMVAVGFRSAGGLALTVVVWALFGVLLLIVAGRARWSGILHHRRRFKRAHVARRYARAAIGLADSVDDLHTVLERVAADFDLTYLKLGGLEIRRASGPGEVEETLPCRGTTAVWRHVPQDEDPVYTEERRSILCELVRRADDRRQALANADTGRRVGFSRAGRACVHFVHGPRDDLAEVMPLVDEARRCGRFVPRLVNSEGGCYRSLLSEDRPSLVVVAGNSAPKSVAHLAREQGIAVAELRRGQVSIAPTDNRSTGPDPDAGNRIAALLVSELGGLVAPGTQPEVDL
jgi:UDP-GlcNAc:undecaprenyl-phosphate GlcNAc-1-phosphate transferase